MYCKHIKQLKMYYFLFISLESIGKCCFESEKESKGRTITSIRIDSTHEMVNFTHKERHCQQSNRLVEQNYQKPTETCCTCL